MNLAKFTENRILHQHLPEGSVDVGPKLGRVQTKMYRIAEKYRNVVACEGQLEPLKARLAALDKKKYDVTQDTKAEFIGELDDISKELNGFKSLEEGCVLSAEDEAKYEVVEPEAADGPAEHVTPEHPDKRLRALDGALRGLGNEFGVNMALYELREDDAITKEKVAATKKFFREKFGVLKKAFGLLREKEPDLLKLIGKGEVDDVFIEIDSDADSSQAAYGAIGSNLTILLSNNSTSDELFGVLAHKILTGSAAKIVEGAGSNAPEAGQIEVRFHNPEDPKKPKTDYWQVIEKWGPELDQAMHTLRTRGQKTLAEMNKRDVDIVAAFGEKNYKDAKESYKADAGWIVVDCANKTADKIYTDILVMWAAKKKERKGTYVESYTFAQKTQLLTIGRLGDFKLVPRAGLKTVATEANYLVITVGNEPLKLRVNVDGDVIFDDPSQAARFYVPNVVERRKFEILDRKKTVSNARFKSPRKVYITENTSTMPGKAADKNEKAYYVFTVGEVNLEDRALQGAVGKAIVENLNEGKGFSQVGAFMVYVNADHQITVVANSVLEKGTTVNTIELLNTKYNEKLAELQALTGERPIVVMTKKAEFLVAFDDLKRALIVNQAKLKEVGHDVSLVIDLDRKSSFRELAAADELMIRMGVNSNDMTADLAFDLKEYADYKARR